MILTKFLRVSGVKFRLLLVCIIALIAAGLSGRSSLIRQGWGLLSVEIILLALVIFYWGFENREVSAKFIAVVAVLGTVAGLGRIPFAALPDVQPTTFMVIISGFVLGPQAGFLVGSTAAVTSGFFLGQGPWTPWQMVAWGLAGAFGGIVKKIFPGLGKGLIIVNFAWGYLFGWIMNIWFWTAFISPLDWRSFVSTCAASAGFDTFHAVGNVVFYLIFGSAFIKILQRFQRKLTVTFMTD